MTDNNVTPTNESTSNTSPNNSPPINHESPENDKNPTNNAEENTDIQSSTTSSITAHLGTPSRDPKESLSETTNNTNKIAGKDKNQQQYSIQPPSLFISPSMEIGNDYNDNEKKKKSGGINGSLYSATEANDDEDEDEDETETQEEEEILSCLKSTTNVRTKNRMKRLEEGTIIVVHFDERVVVHTVPYWDPCGEVYDDNDDDDDDDIRGSNCCTIL